MPSSVRVRTSSRLSLARIRFVSFGAVKLAVMEAVTAVGRYALAT